jgi:hypothetical protein
MLLYLEFTSQTNFATRLRQFTTTHEYSMTHAASLSQTAWKLNNYLDDSGLEMAMHT